MLCKKEITQRTLFQKGTESQHPFSDIDTR